MKELLEKVEVQRKGIETTLKMLERNNLGDDNDVVERYKGILQGLDWVIATDKIISKDKTVDFRKHYCVVCTKESHYNHIKELWEAHGANTTNVPYWGFYGEECGMVVDSDLNIQCGDVEHFILDSKQRYIEINFDEYVK